MLTDSSPLQIDLESLAQDLRWQILSFLGVKDLGIVMSLNRNFRQLLLSRNADALWRRLCRRNFSTRNRNLNDLFPNGRRPFALKAYAENMSRAEFICRLVCTHLQVDYKNIIVQTLLLLGHRPWSPIYKEQLIDAIVLYAKRGRDNSKAVWNFPFSLGVPVNRHLLKRLSLYGNEKKVFDYLVDDMKKALMSLRWIDFNGHEEIGSLALNVQRMWGLVLDYKKRNNTKNSFIIYPKEEVLSPLSDQNAANFRLFFIENVVIPLAKGKVAIPLPISVLETIYDFWSPIPREKKLARNTLYLLDSVGCYDYNRIPNARLRSKCDHVMGYYMYKSSDDWIPVHISKKDFPLFTYHDRKLWALTLPPRAHTKS